MQTKSVIANIDFVKAKKKCYKPAFSCFQTFKKIKPLKILHFYKRSLPQSLGGVEQAISTICEFSESKEITNTVFALAPRNATIIDGKQNYKTIFHRELFEIASTPISLSVIFRFSRLVRDTDLVHFHYPYPLADIVSFFCFRKRYIVTYHSDIVKQKLLRKIIYPIEWFFLKRAYAIVATSPNYIETSPFLRKFKEKVLTIPLGCNIDQIPAEDNFDQQNEFIGLNKPYFLFIGHNRYYKGLHILFDALEKAPDLDVVIAGENHQEFFEIAKIKNLKNIRFFGKVNDEQKYYLMRNSMGFVYPSHLRSEAFGIVLVEASLCECPLISCEIGTGTSFVNIHQETGIVIKPSSSEELIKAMRLLKNNPKQAENYGKNARKRALSFFTAKQQATSYEALYNKVINSDI